MLLKSMLSDKPLLKELSHIIKNMLTRLRRDKSNVRLLYCIGLLPATVLFFPAAMAWQTLPADGDGWQVWVLYAFGLAVAVFMLGARLKAKSWRVAARDGINVNDY